MRILFILLALGLVGCQTGGFDPYKAELKGLTGLVEPEESLDDRLFKVYFYPSLSLPEKFDWRDKGLVKVKNQRNCGGCWAFATVSILEDIIKIKQGKERDLSEQYLINCNEEGWNCRRGGWFAHDYHMSKGVEGAVKESQFPYVARDGQCKSGLIPVERIIDWNYIEENPEQIKHAIYNYGPVATSVYVNSAFQNYRRGVFRNCSDRQVNHAVTLVGWGPGYWIMKNSWGPNWGEDGYMRIEFGCNNIGYRSNFIVYDDSPPDPPEPDPDPQPDPEPDPLPPKPWYCNYTCAWSCAKYCR